MVDLISKELQPDEVCRELIFCVTENERELQDYDSGLDLLRMAFENEDEVEVDFSENDVSGELAQPGCVLCEFVIQKIEDDLNDKKTDEEIKKVVKDICSKMPSTIAKQCTQFVDYYFDMIIALIETSPPDQVCERMQLCPKKLELKLTEVKNDVYSCAVCRGVVETMDSIIEDPQIDTNLENLEEKICVKFAGKFKDKCHNLASTYGLAIINLLKNMAESDQICFKLDLCSNQIGAEVSLV
jgi:saposin